MIEEIVIIGGGGLVALALLYPSQQRRGPVVAVTTSLVPGRLLASASPALAKALAQVAPVKAAMSSTANASDIFSLRDTPRTVEGVNLTLSKNQVGISIGGAGHVVRNVTFRGGYKGVYMAGATSDVTIDGLTVIDASGYGVYLANGAKHTPNANITINNLIVRLEADGEHCVRLYNATELIINNATLVQRAHFQGTTIAAKQISGFAFSNITTDGRAPAFGPLRTPEEGALGYKCENGEVTDFHFTMDTFLDLGAGMRNVAFRRGIMHQEKNIPLLNFRGSYLSNAAPENITFEKVDFSGGSRLVAGDASKAKFLNCTYNGAPL